MDGNTTWTLGSSFMEVSAPSEDTNHPLPSRIRTSAGRNGSGATTGSRTCRYFSTTSRNASMRVFTPASAVWLSSSRVREGFSPCSSRK
jgi:hypothetical protein